MNHPLRRRSKAHHDDPKPGPVDDWPAGHETLNSAATAREIGEQPPAFDDDRWRDPDDELVTPQRPWETKRAVGLGEAAGRSVWADGLRRSIAPDRAVAKKCYTEYDELAPVHRRDDQQHADAVEADARARAVPKSVLPDFYRKLSKLAKLIMFFGDAAAIAYVFWKAGAPILLALPVGATGAASIVSLGSMSGHQQAVSSQRDERGDPPDDCSPELRCFFREPAPADLGDDEWLQPRPERPWLIAGAVAIPALLGALTLIGAGTGESGLLALGAALLAGLTLPGSAAAEALGTNEAADHKVATNARVAETRKLLSDNTGRLGEAAGLEERSDILLCALAAEAPSAAELVRWIAGREPDNPRQFGIDVPEGAGQVADVVPTFERRLPSLRSPAAAGPGRAGPARNVSGLHGEFSGEDDEAAA